MFIGIQILALNQCMGFFKEGSQIPKGKKNPIREKSKQICKCDPTSLLITCWIQVQFMMIHIMGSLGLVY